MSAFVLETASSLFFSWLSSSDWSHKILQINMISPSYLSIHGLFVWAVVEKQLYLVGY
jgi:hypothetical protein